MSRNPTSPQTRKTAALLHMTLKELCHRYYLDDDVAIAREIANRMSRITDGSDNPGKEVRVEGQCSHCGSQVELHQTVRIKQII